MGIESDAEQIAFEERDTAIFAIPDIKTRLDTLQYYLFPRLRRLLDGAVDQLRAVYDVDPYEDMTVTYRPAHREDAKVVRDFGEVYVGLTPKRTKEPLQVFHRDGAPYFFGPSSLVLGVEPVGALQVSFRPYLYTPDTNFCRRFHQTVDQHWDVLGPVLEHAHVACGSVTRWTPLRASLLDRGFWFTPVAPFPLAEDHWLGLVLDQFIALYPMLDTAMCLTRGLPVRLPDLLERYKAAVEARAERMAVDDDVSDAAGGDEEVAEVELPELDSYRMIRPGKWYAVLARDRWTCCSCGRSTGDHNVRLEVDHIQPRSKGGTDDMNNLQTLCRKCNIGKSNKDDTRLTTA